MGAGNAARCPEGAAAMSAAAPERMPALYLSHGAPPLADDPVWPGELAAWSAGLPRPKAILMVSAHWEEAPLALGAVRTVPLVYDFWGFPEHYYQVRYAAPGAPELAESVRKLLRAPPTPPQSPRTRRRAARRSCGSCSCSRSSPTSSSPGCAARAGWSCSSRAPCTPRATPRPASTSCSPAPW